MVLALVLAAGTAAAAGPTPTRQAELNHLLIHDCGSCHGMTMKGGLGPSLLPQALVERTDDDLLASIVEGHPGTAMPPWGPLLNPGEAEWLVRRLREGAGLK
ncbi:MAG: cytochrome c [Rhodobacterales bacterium]|nr:cytochrome c [Rhodobacterales bacterium]